MRSIELLAPAGTPEALHAAVEAGANAVYLGLESFNARRGAGNFTLETLAQACDYAHLRGVRIFVTMNTMILPKEIKEALELARQAWRKGADAFIVQDLGLASELSRTLPEAELHISTQMNTHNLAGIRAAARLGAKRVTLARELSLPEIELLSQEANALGMEVEAFAHGALCVCYSGQCLMSSLIGGRSANRGTCAQACRLPYELKSASSSRPLSASGEHLLSPRDLCSIDVLARMVDAGVSSFKIEGRMKSPEYVSAVVGVYREVLDRVIAAPEDERLLVKATPEEMQELEEAFSRGFTTGYLEGKRDNEIMSYQRPNNRGVFAGRVSRVKDGVAFVSTLLELADGDVLEFWTSKGHSAQEIAGLSFTKDGDARIRLNASVRGVRQGDRVFRVRSAAQEFCDDPTMPRVPVSGTVRIQKGKPLVATFRATVNGVVYEGTAQGSVVEAARTKALEYADAESHIDRLGSTPFVMKNLEIELDEGVGLGFSQLHHVRADALDELQESILGEYRSRRLPRIPDRDEVSTNRRSKLRVVAWVTNPACARVAKRTGAEALYVPALNYARGTSQVAGQVSAQTEQAGFPKQCIVAMPTIDHEFAGSAREAWAEFDPWKWAGEEGVFVDSLAGMQQASEAGLACEVGSHVPIVNEESLRFAADMGAKMIWLSPELNLAQIADLGKKTSVDLGLTVIGAQELMITEHCLLMSQGPCNQECDSCPRRKTPHVLRDRKGFEFPVVTDRLGRSHLYNSVQLDIVPSIPDLIASGVTSFMVDATLMNTEQTAQAVSRVVRAIAVANDDGNSLAKVHDTTSGHLHRGVS